MADNDGSPISVREAKQLFADWKAVPAIVLAVSGGPDSLALMWLAARWRKSLRRGPQLIAVTIDHGLRGEAAGEARQVKRLARALELPHRTLRWRDVKPATGLPAAAREARYRLLAKAARAHGATHMMTAHTRDDQAETLLMRLSRGSGIAGLAAMPRQAPRDGLMLARPLLEVPKARLVATLDRAKIAFVTDPSNADPRFTRPRLRGLMPLLADEGCDSRNLARLAARFARANAALELLTDGAERYLALQGHGDAKPGFDARAFAGLAAEIRVRLLLRAVNKIGHEGQAELGKVEALAAALEQAGAETGPVSRTKGRIRLKQTLAGALVTLTAERLRIEPAPPRRRRD
ncbi:MULTISPECIES: tRNA lysidine(34) synthetase TilS [Rhodopseudomonas]|uniref:tRNA(Ile)-lysidine synthase n=1 Tax=Rhodopseudomonas palustris TaxID=1076 RepID=A0A0D7EUW3_RHOPL|nr:MULTISPECIES: tRNA lysidine(34) synthetase TilS [Rhodopseudomonas]KIZ44345.1 tRNA(Ile)-lysidine synthetase [Rhodopseudomonas palustris]MDF3811467.1 tRNA lysidine(34) synthetase TilS [Rhodopseudomonas sp. BAL398]WOK17399.1 tRNA lysidine(34) synthetase TilS [Rhodopseudomonas sp. BAL398]